MYNSKYGYGVYKKSQVNMGNPFTVQPPVPETPLTSLGKDREASDFVPMDTLERTRQEALLMLREAEMEAERLMSEAKEMARQDADSLRKKAREEGYLAGEKQAQEQYATLIAEAEETLTEANEAKQETISGLESQLVALVIDIAKKMVGKALKEQPETILSIIRSTLADVTPTDQAVVKISTADYDYVMSHMDDLTASLDFLCDLDIRKDNSLLQGACVVVTSYGTANGGVDVRLKQVEDAFAALLLGRPETPVSGSAAKDDPTLGGI